MAYMSKTKKKRVRRQQLFRAVIAACIIVAVLVTIWQIGLGGTVVKVGNVSVRSGMVKGVEAFINYYQTGQFPDKTGSGLTGDAKQTALDTALVQTNSLVQSVIVSTEVIKQHFKDEGTVFPDTDAAAQIKSSVDTVMNNTDLVKTLSSNGVGRQHVEYYYTYVAAMTAMQAEAVANKPITADEEQQYYNDNISYFTTPLSMQASHILIKDPDHTAAKRAEIQSILDQLNNGADFAEMAKQYSEDSSASNGGDLGSFGLGQMVKPFEDACLALQPGEISGIVETEYGFHIIKLTSRTDASVTSLADAKTTIDQMIGSTRLTDAIDSLIAAATIKYTGLINPTTGKPPMNLTELNEARGTPSTTDTGTTDTSTTDTGATDTTGTTDTGATDTTTVDGITTDTGAAGTGTIDPGANDTSSTDTAATDGSTTDTGATDTGAAGTGTIDPGATDTGSTDTAAADGSTANTGATGNG